MDSSPMSTRPSDFISVDVPLFSEGEDPPPRAHLPSEDCPPTQPEAEDDPIGDGGEDDEVVAFFHVPNINEMGGVGIFRIP